ncbi:MAG: ABC transporter substrate-binding protein, partial [Nitrososphaerota archaeon]|nr:ABC transporter substrate-binding protein [Nitrososphaerota archaeon]
MTRWPKRRGKRRGITRTTAGIAAIIVVLLAVATYSAINFGKSASPTSTTTSLQTANLTVGILPTADTVPFLVAIQNGYFAQQGINITLKFMSGGPTVAPAVAQGSIQIGAANPIAIMAADEQGFDFKYIAPSDVTSYPNGTQTTTYVPGVSTHILGVLS